MTSRVREVLGTPDINAPEGFHIRRLSSHAEYEACVRLQYVTWGESFTESVPSSILKVAQMMGGITGGAFREGGALVGFVFSLPGFMHGEPAQWSDLLAAAPQYRGRGIGRALKWFQRREALREGFRYVYWTYDPLEARNASFNIRSLGALPVEYIEDMYVSSNRSMLHAGLSMDRFTVKWDLNSPLVTARAGSDFAEDNRVDEAVPVLEFDPRNMEPRVHPVPGPGFLSVEIPPDIQHLKRMEPAIARQWRRSTRKLFKNLLGAGYRVIAFRKNPVPAYILDRGP